MKADIQEGARIGPRDMRFTVQKTGRLGTRAGSYSGIEDALRYAEHLIANKNPGQVITLHDKRTGKIYREDELADFIAALADG